MVMRSKQPSSIRSSDKVDSRTIWRSATVSKVFVDDSLKKDKFWAFKIDMNLGFRVRNRIVLFWFDDGANRIPWLIRPQKLLSKDVGRKFTLKWFPFDHPWPCDKISDFPRFKFSNRFFHCKKFLKKCKIEETHSMSIELESDHKSFRKIWKSRDWSLVGTTAKFPPLYVLIHISKRLLSLII